MQPPEYHVLRKKLLLVFCPVLLIAFAGMSYSTEFRKRSTAPVDLSSLLQVHGEKLGASTQLLLVTTDEPMSHVTKLYGMEKRGDIWQTAFGPIETVLGRNGFAAPGKKREGDGKTPTGIFALSMVFGYEKQVTTRMSYRMVTMDDVWVDDVNSPDYNSLAKREGTTALSFEEMRRPDNLYRYGIVIEYNTNPVVKGHGSAIFIHVWRSSGEPTAGCIAMAEEDIKRIIVWLDPAQAPLLVLGEKP